MKTIRCKNIIIDSDGKKTECGRILAVLTDMQIDILRADLESPIFRCPRCASEQRWSSISFDKSTGKFVFKTLSKQPEFAGEMAYGDLEICEQVG